MSRLETYIQSIYAYMIYKNKISHTLINLTISLASLTLEIRKIEDNQDF